MDELPNAIQNEIWDYVRGNRAYWKQQFHPILKIVKFINQKLWDDVENFEDSGRAALEVGIDEKYTDYVSLMWNGQCYWSVQYPGCRSTWTSDIGQAMKDFYQRIEYMVIKHNF